MLLLEGLGEMIMLTTKFKPGWKTIKGLQRRSSNNGVVVGTKTVSCVYKVNAICVFIMFYNAAVERK